MPKRYFWNVSIPRSCSQIWTFSSGFALFWCLYFVPASFQKFLRPAVIQALGDALAATQRRDALFASKARQNDADLLLCRISLAGLAADVLNQLGSSGFAGSGFLVHLYSMKVAMNQKSSVTKTSNLSQRCRRQTRHLVPKSGTDYLCRG